MGGMMSGGLDMWPWVALLIFLGCVVAVSAGIANARTVGWHKAEQPQITPPESTGTQRAWDALRLRYAKGEISREEYLQGKVELEAACHSPDQPKRLVIAWAISSGASSWM
jgi:putative membrane protein